MCSAVLEPGITIARPEAQATAHRLHVELLQCSATNAYLTLHPWRIRVAFSKYVALLGDARQLFLQTTIPAA
jgi:hypothetical protein